MKLPKSENAGEDRVALTRKLVRTLTSALEITDFLALMMVLATGFSAYATWKMEQVTNQILLISQRPYIGTESIDLLDDKRPKVAVDLRNFGTVQAEHTIISMVVLINGKPLSSDLEAQQQKSPVVFSPGVPHRFYRHLTTDIYQQAIQGKVTLLVEIRVRYRGPRGDEHCYLTQDNFDNLDNIFYPVGGSLRCDAQSG